MKILPINISQGTVKVNPVPVIQQKYEPSEHSFGLKSMDSLREDTFTSSNPSFRSNPQEVSRAILKNKTLLGLFSAGLAATFTKAFQYLVKSSVAENEVADIDEEIQENITEQFIKFFTSQNNETKVSDLEAQLKAIEEENEKLNQENKALLEKIAQQEFVLADINSSKETSVTEDNSESVQEEPVTVTKEEEHVIFPSRRRPGKLPEMQQALKSVVTGLNITPEYNEKLTGICSDILQKDSKDAENRERTINLTKDLKECNGDSEKLKAVVDKYAVKISPQEVKEETNEQSETVTKNEDIKKEESTNVVSKEAAKAKEETPKAVEVYDPVKERKVESNIKVLGTIDLSKIKGRPRRVSGSSDSKKNDKQTQNLNSANSVKAEDTKKNVSTVIADNQKNETSAAEKTQDGVTGTSSTEQKTVRTGKRPRFIINKTTDGNVNNLIPEKDSADNVSGNVANPIITQCTPIPGEYSFYVPGTVPKDMKENLTNALTNFQKRYIQDLDKKAAENGNKREYIKWSVCNTPLEHVEKRHIIEEIKRHENDLDPRSKYRNIKERNAAAVAKAINSEQRFRKMFTFHGAVRFIERLVDFDAAESIEYQVSRALDVLEQTIQKAIKTKGYITLTRHDKVKPGKNGEKAKIYINPDITLSSKFYDDDAYEVFGDCDFRMGICEDGGDPRQAIICTVYRVGI